MSQSEDEVCSLYFFFLINFCKWVAEYFLHKLNTVYYPIFFKISLILYRFDRKTEGNEKTISCTMDKLMLHRFFDVTFSHTKCPEPFLGIKNICSNCISKTNQKSYPPHQPTNCSQYK